MRLAFFSPMPPARSGIADYSSALVEPLRALAEVELFEKTPPDFHSAKFDLCLYQITDDTDQAVKIITRFYRNFHSSRFVKELFVIRLKHAPSDSALEAMTEDFADINTGPPIKRIKPTREEVEDGDHVDLPRIAFNFNRKDYGRLRQMIDVLNSL